MTRELRERVKAAIAEKFAPGIDFKAPYAKVMLDMAADAALATLTLADHIAAVEAAGMVVTRPGKRWRHRKRGTTYRISEPVTIQCETPIQDGEQLIGYRADVDGTLWARRPAEFYDGRFEALAARPRDAAPDPEPGR